MVLCKFCRGEAAKLWECAGVRALQWTFQCFLFVFSMKEEITRVYQYICHATELCLVLWVWLMILKVFSCGQGTEKYAENCFRSLCYTLQQEKASLLYFCEFPHNALCLFGMQNESWKEGETKLIKLFEISFSTQSPSLTVFFLFAKTECLDTFILNWQYSRTERSDLHFLGEDISFAWEYI